VTPVDLNDPGAFYWRQSSPVNKIIAPKDEVAGVGWDREIIRFKEKHD